MIYKGYRINEPRKPAKLYICNCVYGHNNCKCDGETGKKIRWLKDKEQGLLNTTVVQYYLEKY